MREFTANLIQVRGQTSILRNKAKMYCRPANTTQLFRVFCRMNSTSASSSPSCTSKFTPLIENYKTLRHIHFPGITSFEKGQSIQNAIVSANLDFKKMESKIKKQQSEIFALGHSLSDYEQEFIGKILQMKPFPTLLTFEFENVYTGGKRIKKQDQDSIKEMLSQNKDILCKYVQLERGGEITWHGKGQLVAYLILDLKKFSDLTVKCFVDSVLLKAVQNTLRLPKYNLPNSGYLNNNPGVWMAPNDLKIASVGCNIQRGISSYGISLNVSPDLKFLNTFTMCGLPGTTATSISKAANPDFALNEEDLTIKEVGFEYAKQIARRLNIHTVEHMSGEEMDI